MNPEGDDTLVILIDGEPQVEYKRDVALSERQQAYLDRMDQEMDAGIQLGEEYLPRPDTRQRAQFVAMSLMRAFQENDEPRIAATTAWLAMRLPQLKQVRAETRPDGRVGIELVFDEPYRPQVKVDFTPQLH